MAAAALPALAQLERMRATIPGALHQCENTNLVFFDTGGDRPLDVLFLPSSQVTASLRSGEVSLDDALEIGPLQAIDGINTPDNDQYNFELQIEEGQVFELFGFLPDGSGKALSLTRTVMTPLPSATNCLRNVQTNIGGAAQTTATTDEDSSSSRATATRSSTTRSAASTSSVSRTSSTMGTQGASTSGSNTASNAQNTQIPTGTAPTSATNAVMGAIAGLVGAAVQFMFF
ncbi:hypothetical protein OIO90_000400 [Microbotryomycetes sp. JL221]|nr:hypothetical protein OIO90_000400 [Microbotryomycetes sp. JL221]